MALSVLFKYELHYKFVFDPCNLVVCGCPLPLVVLLCTNTFCTKLWLGLCIFWPLKIGCMWVSVTSGGPIVY